MINYAHRGASEYAPENTMSSFCLGVRMGANAIETDVQRTRDGVLVLHHDLSLKRTANVDRQVADVTFDELSQMDMGSFKSPVYAGERIVPLRDFLYYFSGRPLLFAFEIKQSGIERETLDMIRQYLPDERFTVTSFMLDSLLALAELERKPRLGYLAREFSIPLLERLVSAHIEEYCPKAEWLTADMAREARSRGLGLRAWGVKTEALMVRMCELGVDGMTVNFPDRLASYLGKR